MNEAVELCLKRLRDSALKSAQETAEHIDFEMEESNLGHVFGSTSSCSETVGNFAPIGIANDMKLILESLLKPFNPAAPGPAPAGIRSRGLAPFLKRVLSKMTSEETEGEQRQRNERELNARLESLKALHYSLDAAFEQIENQALRSFRTELQDNWKTTAEIRSKARRDSTH
jgi:hypothetical protein